MKNKNFNNVEVKKMDSENGGFDPMLGLIIGVTAFAGGMAYEKVMRHLDQQWYDERQAFYDANPSLTRR